jgi:hypothetical protein
MGFGCDAQADKVASAAVKAAPRQALGRREGEGCSCLSRTRRRTGVWSGAVLQKGVEKRDEGAFDLSVVDGLLRLNILQTSFEFSASRIA